MELLLRPKGGAVLCLSPSFRRTGGAQRVARGAAGCFNRGPDQAPGPTACAVSVLRSSPFGRDFAYRLLHVADTFLFKCTTGPQKVRKSGWVGGRRYFILYVCPLFSCRKTGTIPVFYFPFVEQFCGFLVCSRFCYFACSSPEDFIPCLFFS